MSHAGNCRPPYTSNSPWNTPIGRDPRYDARSATLRAGLGERITSDPTQYTFPIYETSSPRPKETTLHIDGVYSDVSHGGTTLNIEHDASVRLPLPADAASAAGSDAQLIVLDRATGDEWGLWQAARSQSGGWSATNGYHYNIGWSGVPPHDPQGRPFGSRGSGVPYLAGLVRPCEIRQGHIDHALALAYHRPSSQFVYPATKSDGTGDPATSMPEGARLQLDPTLSARRLTQDGCRGPCLIIARAMQRYGMYVIDSSGRAKVIVEYEGTARWRGQITAATVSSIPVSALRLLAIRR